MVFIIEQPNARKTGSTWSSEECQLPDPKQAIWRYLTLGKFLAMLDTRALFFCRLELLEDIFEGSYPRNEPPVEAPEYRR